MESLDDIILALRAAGWDAPQYEVLADGSYHFFHSPQQSLVEPSPMDICGMYTVSYTHLTLPTIYSV